MRVVRGAEAHARGDVLHVQRRRHGPHLRHIPLPLCHAFLSPTQAHARLASAEACALICNVSHLQIGADARIMYIRPPPHSSCKWYLSACGRDYTLAFISAGRDYAPSFCTAPLISDGSGAGSWDKTVRLTPIEDVRTLAVFPPPEAGEHPQVTLPRSPTSL